MNKAKLSHFLRNMRFIKQADILRFWVEKWRNGHKNRMFKRTHPQVALPPDYLLYESFHLNYNSYYFDGQETAKDINRLFSKYMQLSNVSILDWGCGPGRIIRHFPALLGQSNKYYATDYNGKSIQWCTQHLPGITFSHNTLDAKLNFPNHFFDAIYGISIFTHLSEIMHHAWLAELLRILKPGGILLITTHGQNFRVKLTADEQTKFDAGKLVVRGRTKEGHRTYAAFHPKTFMHEFLAQTKILEHIEQPANNNNWLPQDFWIVQKL